MFPHVAIWSNMPKSFPRYNSGVLVPTTTEFDTDHPFGARKKPSKKFLHPMLLALATGKGSFLGKFRRGDPWVLAKFQSRLICIKFFSKL